MYFIICVLSCGITSPIWYLLFPLHVSWCHPPHLDSSYCFLSLPRSSAYPPCLASDHLAFLNQSQWHFTQCNHISHNSSVKKQVVCSESNINCNVKKWRVLREDSNTGAVRTVYHLQLMSPSILHQCFLPFLSHSCFFLLMPSIGLKLVLSPCLAYQTSFFPN